MGKPLFFAEDLGLVPASTCCLVTSSWQACIHVVHIHTCRHEQVLECTCVCVPQHASGSEGSWQELVLSFHTIPRGWTEAVRPGPGHFKQERHLKHHAHVSCCRKPRSLCVSTFLLRCHICCCSLVTPVAS